MNPKKESLLKRLVPYMEDKKYLFPISLFLSAISAILSLLPFVFIWFIAREIFKSQQDINMGNINSYAWLTLLSALVSMIVYFFALLSSHLAAFRVEIGMRKVGMQKIINMPLGFFTENSSGKMRKVIDDNASQTHTFLAHQMPDISASIISPIALLGILFVFDWRLGLVSLIPIALGLISMSFMMTKKGEEFRNLYMDYLEEMSSEAVEYVRGIPVVKTFGQSVFSFKRFVGSINKYKEMVYAFTEMWRNPMSFYTIIMQTSAFFLVPFAILFITNGDNVAMVLTDFIFYLLIAPNFTLIMMRSMYFKNYAEIAAQTIDRFDAILDYPEMIFPKKGNLPKNNDLSFKDVSFSYNNSNEDVLQKISFDIKEGETVALVGQSGGGKTTIARLAARFWDVKNGSISIGGVNIKDIDKNTLMKTIAFVFQNTRLFKTNLRENIVYGNKSKTDSDIENAVVLSQSKEFIDALPEGLDTIIGKEGTYLSGGEQQRIALARAILKDAPLVILDEATAFADPENEHLIQKALKELSKGKTTLMIAHRLTSVTNADKILVIDKGRIIEEGKHEELLQLDGVYTKMWQEYKESINWKI